MTIASEISKLASILEEKEVFILQRIEAVLAGKSQRARFIENQIYPEYGRRIRAQISRINEIWNIKNESEGYEAKQAN
jgi:hypothetical protein